MPFKLSIADSTDATITGTRSTGACNTLLVAKVLTAPVLETPVIVANGKTFTLFCREFENVVNRAFLVLVFWVKNWLVQILHVLQLCIPSKSKN